MKILKKEGITLIALIITIVILLLLAGTSFNAITGENGIIAQAMGAKIKQEDEGAKEELHLAWSARMSKFYEDLSNGLTSYDNIGNYFSDKSELNEMLGGGEIKRITYNGDGTFDIRYKSSGNINYLGTIKSSGEIEKLERTEDNIEYTEVWVSYYEIAGEGILTYASSRELKLDEQEPRIQWDITGGLNNSNTPWRSDDYIEKIKKVDILDSIVPEKTDCLFYRLKNLDGTIGHIDNLLNNISIIGSRMFYQSGLTKLTIPSNIKSIEELAFNMSKISKLELSEGLRTIKDEAFGNCFGLTEISLPNSLTDLEGSVFIGCSSLRDIAIPNNVVKIDSMAFYWCSSLESITIGKSVKKISSTSFIGCDNLKTINYNAENASETVVYNSSSNSVSKIFDYLETLNIGASVRVIPEYLFAFTNIKDLKMEYGVTDIGRFAFLGCSSLTSITIPDSVKTIGSYAFYNCTAATNLTVGENVEEMGKYCFRNCNNISTVDYNAKDASKTIVFDSSTNTVSTLFSSTNLKTLNIGSSVEIIPQFIFAFSEIEEVNIDDGVTLINSYAFYGCSSLTNITIPNSVKEIKTYVFYNCTSLTKIIIQKSEGDITGAPWGAPNAISIEWKSES